MTPDPIGLTGGINLYAYVDADPINYFDPNGKGKTGAAAGAFLGGAIGYVAAAAETAGTGGIGGVAAPAIVAGSAAIGAGIGHYAEEGITSFGTIWDDLTSDIPESAADDTCKEDNDGRCEKQLARDNATCDAIARFEKAGKRPKGAAHRCYSSAMERYGNCLAGRPLGPLDTWNN